MMDVQELERTIQTLRNQAQVMNNTADQLEACVQPLKLMQSYTANWNQAIESWMKVWQPPK